jgi:hypothetical protein
LANTCPRIAYTRTQNDLAYANRLRASWHITTSVCLVLTQLWGRLMVVKTSEKCGSLILKLAFTESVRSYQTGWENGCDHVWKAAGNKTSCPWKGQTRLEDLLAEEKAAHLEDEGKKRVASEAGSRLEDIRNTLIADACNGKNTQHG